MDTYRGHLCVLCYGHFLSSLSFPAHQTGSADRLMRGSGASDPFTQYSGFPEPVDFQSRDSGTVVTLSI